MRQTTLTRRLTLNKSLGNSNVNQTFACFLDQWCCFKQGFSRDTLIQILTKEEELAFYAVILHGNVLKCVSEPYLCFHNVSCPLTQDSNRMVKTVDAMCPPSRQPTPISSTGCLSQSVSYNWPEWTQLSLLWSYLLTMWPAISKRGDGFDPTGGRLIHIVITNGDMGGFQFHRTVPMRCSLETNSLHAVFHQLKRKDHACFSKGFLFTGFWKSVWTRHRGTVCHHVGAIWIFGGLFRSPRPHQAFHSPNRCFLRFSSDGMLPFQHTKPIKYWSTPYHLGTRPVGWTQAYFKDMLPKFGEDGLQLCSQQHPPTHSAGVQKPDFFCLVLHVDGFQTK